MRREEGKLLEGQCRERVVVGGWVGRDTRHFYWEGFTGSSKKAEGNKLDTNED